MVYIPTAHEISSSKTAKGGYNRITLKKWGVPWPPPAGWLKALYAQAVEVYGEDQTVRSPGDPITLDDLTISEGEMMTLLARDPDLAHTYSDALVHLMKVRERIREVPPVVSQNLRSNIAELITKIRQGSA